VGLGSEIFYVNVPLPHFIHRCKMVYFITGLYMMASVDPTLRFLNIRISGHGKKRGAK
jgi:hypothetical protein